MATAEGEAGKENLRTVEAHGEVGKSNTEDGFGIALEGVEGREGLRGRMRWQSEGKERVEWSPSPLRGLTEALTPLNLTCSRALKPVEESELDRTPSGRDLCVCE